MAAVAVLLLALPAKLFAFTTIPPKPVPPSWPQAMFDSSRTGHAPDLPATSNCGVHWRANVTFSVSEESSASVSVSPVVDGFNNVFWATGLGKVYKANGDDGKIIWVYDTGKKGVSTYGPDIALGTRGEIVYVTIQDLVVAVYTQTGKQAWRFERGPEIFHTLTVSQSGRLFTSTLSSVFSLQPSSGAVLWETPLRTNFRGAAISTLGARPIYFGSVGCTQVTASDNCTFTALDQTTGKILESTPAIGSINDAFVLPLAVSANGALHTIKREENGAKILLNIDPFYGVQWNFTCPSAAAVEGFVLVQDSVYVGCSGGTFHVLDSRRGEEQWSLQGLNGTKVVAFVGDSTILYGGIDSFGAIDVSKRAPAWSCDVKGDNTEYYPAVGLEGEMFVPSYMSENLVYIYGARGVEVPFVENKTAAIAMAVIGALMVTMGVGLASYFYRKRQSYMSLA